MEYNGPLFDEGHARQKVKEFISGSKISIVAVSAAVEEAFVETLSGTGIEIEIIHPKSKKFPNASFVIADGKRIMIVSGSLNMDLDPGYRHISEMGIEEMEIILQLFSELKEKFSIEV